MNRLLPFVIWSSISLVSCFQDERPNLISRPAVGDVYVVKAGSGTLEYGVMRVFEVKRDSVYCLGSKMIYPSVSDAVASIPPGDDKQYYDSIYFWTYSPVVLLRMYYNDSLMEVIREQ